MLTKSKLTAVLVGTGLLLCAAAPAQAGYLSTILSPGVDNTFEDQSRELFFDRSADGNTSDGIFGVGDILTGFVRIDDKTGPDDIDIDNRIYGIFTQQVKSVSAAGAIEWEAVTAGNGLSLSELGVAGAGVNDMVALYTNAAGFSADLIGQSPGDRVGAAGITMADYLDLIISEGELEVLGGLYDAPICLGGDCFQATSNLAGAPTGTFIDLPSGITVANFLAGLDTSLDPAGFELADVVAAGAFAAPATPFTLAEIAIKNGAVSGSGGLVNEAEWINGIELSSLNQCFDGEVFQPCGFANDADFVVHPLRVPEPASIALMGLGLLGFGAARRRQSRS